MKTLKKQTLLKGGRQEWDRCVETAEPDAWVPGGQHGRGWRAQSVPTSAPSGGNLEALALPLPATQSQARRRGKTSPGTYSFLLLWLVLTWKFGKPSASLHRS